MIGDSETQKLMTEALHYRAQLQRTAIAKRKDIDSMKAAKQEANNFVSELILGIAGGEDQISLIEKTVIELDKVFPIVEKTVVEEKRVVLLPPAKPVSIPVVEK